MNEIWQLRKYLSDLLNYVKYHYNTSSYTMRGLIDARIWQTKNEIKKHLINKYRS